MIPEPAKKSWHFPIPAPALEYFCHPTMEPFTKPVRHGYVVLAASGYAALRVRRLQGDPEDYAEASPVFLKRWNALPWEEFDSEANKGEWRMMDAVRGDIYRELLLPLWQEEKGKASFTRDHLVLTAGGPLLPLALLQLLARLPRVELRMCGTLYTPALMVRFSGGEAIVPARFPDPFKSKVTFDQQLFKPKPGSLLPGGLV